MMTRIIVILILIGGLLAAGCNKEQEEIDALQQDATEEDAAAILDSLESGGREVVDTAGEYVEPVATERQPEPEIDEPEPDYTQISGFVVQIGSYSDRELANYWSEKYQNRDFPAFLRQVEVDGQQFFRLRVGVYDTYEEAKEVGELLEDRYSATYWVDNNR